MVERWRDGRGQLDGHRPRRSTGGECLPVLANAYLHQVFDLWVQSWRKRKVKGDMIFVRYADDFVVGIQRRWEAEAFLSDLRERFAQFGLDLHPEKTRLIEFGRFARAKQKTQDQGKPETFDFLCMTHFCAKTLTREIPGWAQTIPKAGEAHPQAPMRGSVRGVPGNRPSCRDLHSHSPPFLRKQDSGTSK